MMHVGKILDVAAGGLHFIDPTNPDNDSDPLKGKRVFRYDLDILSRATAVDSFGSGNVTKLQASTGGVLGTFSVGSSPSSVAFDGVNIWVTCSLTNSVFKL